MAPRLSLGCVFGRRNSGAPWAENRHVLAARPTRSRHPPGRSFLQLNPRAVRGRCVALPTPGAPRGLPLRWLAARRTGPGLNAAARWRTPSRTATPGQLVHAVDPSAERLAQTITLRPIERGVSHPAPEVAELAPPVGREESMLERSSFRSGHSNEWRGPGGGQLCHPFPVTAAKPGWLHKELAPPKSHPITSSSPRKTLAPTDGGGSRGSFPGRKPGRHDVLGSRPLQLAPGGLSVRGSSGACQRGPDRLADTVSDLSDRLATRHFAGLRPLRRPAPRPGPGGLIEENSFLAERHPLADCGGCAGRGGDRAMRAAAPLRDSRILPTLSP